ncbi:MAG: COG1470 family protein [Coriobacteriia bacterium]
MAMLLPIAPTSALVRTTITIDGSFADWTPVFDDSANCQYDPAGDSSNTDADLTLVAATGDANYLYTYMRRGTASGGAAPEFLVFIDLDGDGRMRTNDRLLSYGLTGSNTFSKATLYEYQPLDVANGDAIDGTLRTDLKLHVLRATLPAGIETAIGEDSGSQFEGRILWTALAGGLPALGPDTPLKLRFYSAQGNSSDYAATIHLVDRRVTVDPDRASGVAAGSTVVYEHTVKNTGNVAARYRLSAASSRGWAVSLRRADDQTPVTADFDLAAGAELAIEVVLTVPLTATDGTRDTLTVTARHVDAAGALTGLASDSATDITTVGPLLVVPDQSGSIHPGGTIVFKNTVINNSGEPQDVNLSAQSKTGWATELFDEAGTTPITAPITLNPGAPTVITVKVTVPSGSATGIVDVTTIEASAVGAPSIRGRGYDTVTVRPELAVSPGGNLPAGPGSSVLYRHTVTNSTAEARTISASAISNLGWQVTVLAADAATPITEVTLLPYGGSAEVVVRVTVPLDAPIDQVDVTTLTVVYGTVSATAFDQTTVAQAATYGVSGFGTPQTAFVLGDQVYARGMGLAPKSTVTFHWTRPDGTVVATADVKVDATRIAQASYTIGYAPEDIGEWTVKITLQGNAVPIATTRFRVNYKASISALAASGGDTMMSPVSVASTLQNGGTSTLDNTSVTYQIWWDADGNGFMTANDFYIDDSGAWTPIGTGSGYSFIRAPIAAIAPGGSFSDAWSISNENFVESGMYKLTAVWRSSANISIDQRTTEFFAVPGKSGLSLTISTTAVDFGAVDPGVTYTDAGIGLRVTSQTSYTLKAEIGGQFQEIGLGTTLVSEMTGIATVGDDYTDTPSITVPWTTNPGDYAATITYTVVADN